MKAALKQFCLDLGFDDVRVAKATQARHADVYFDWVEAGKHGEMAWMAKDPVRRSDPRLVVEGAKSVLVLATNYFQGGEPPVGLEARIARYAWNNDYHDLIDKRLKILRAHMESLGGNQRLYVDTGPVLERDFANEAGMGWNGKSTMQIHRKLGTWYFLSTVITTLDLEPDPPVSDFCGKCTRCMDQCPTGAIEAPHSMDARKCISYLTIESKSAIPLEYRKAIGDRVYGCDACLDACPWNRFAQISHEAWFQARESIFQTPLRDFLALSDAAFRELFSKSPIKRIKRPAFLRNVCVVLGNIGKAEDLPALRAVLADPDPLIVEHAQWAITEIELRLN